MRHFLLIILICLSPFCIQAKEKFLIGFSQCSAGDWRENMEAEMERELMFHEDLEIIKRQAEDSTLLQIQQIDELVKKGIDLIIIAPNEIDALLPVVEKVYDSGIPVILIDRKINSPKYTAYIGGNNFDIGNTAGVYIANKLNNEGQVIELLGILSSSPALERMNGFSNAIDKFPNIDNVYKIRAKWSNELVSDSLSLILKKYPSVKAIFSHTDFMAEAASKIVRENFPDRDILIVGVDGLPNEGGGIELVKKGIISATLIYPTGGKEAIQTAARILHNQDFQKNNLLPTTLIDHSNVDITRIQFQNINALQEDITKSKEMLERLNGRYRDQQILLFVSLVLLTLVAILLGMYLWSFKRLKISNKNLEEQKEAISAQNIELKRLSDELEKVTQERLRFYTNISHEFRTPLTLISGPIDNLSKNENLTGEQKDLLRIAKKNVFILLKLIEQIIDFRKYELGKHDFSPVSADLKKHFTDWNELFAEVAKHKQINFRMEAVSEDDFIIDFDVEKMERIYTNLLSNAFKFTPEKGTIRVLIEREFINEKDSVKVQVINSGKSIPENKIKEIFDRFYQAGSKTGGSGIGLALVKGYVNLHGGKIDVTNPNGFVCFTFYIPVKQEESIVSNEPEKSSETIAPAKRNEAQDIITQIIGSEDSYTFDDEYDERKTTVLLVDDHPGIRSYLKSLLREKYCILEAKDGIEGIRKAVRYIPDLIISDVMMPGIDGVEMCSHLKKELSTSHIPIILLTANAQDEKRILGFESGADDYISKPVNFEMLEVRIRNLIEGRKQLKATFGSVGDIHSTPIPTLNPEKSFIDKLEEQIEKHIENSELSVDFLSNELGMSRIQLYRKVKALTNYSPVEFITLFRLRKAVHLMKMTDTNLAQIAYQVGFSAPSYFSKSFKKYYGKSPSEYLKEIKVE
ncbi:substrate-binding domain-containing protein [Draconibacterium orientale]|uniref:substrate-binding domain-containing protein n=1 Tax=Draconibacterium orientale TaxID=1168034 RepID=UPI002A0A68F9|nr:substrate-binding domain-containing protein [Draconibacterium orientale]